MIDTATGLAIIAASVIAGIVMWLHNVHTGRKRRQEQADQDAFLASLGLLPRQRTAAHDEFTRRLEERVRSQQRGGGRS